MGGGAHFPYPKTVWSPAGGWWANPVHWKRNTGIAAVTIAALCVPIFVYSANREVRAVSCCRLCCRCARGGVDWRDAAQMCGPAFRSQLVHSLTMFTFTHVQRRPLSPAWHIPSQGWCKYAKDDDPTL
jgi:hypothetical protein